MGIVSSIGNSPRRFWRPSARRARASPAPRIFSAHGFRSQVAGAPTLDAEAVVDRRAMRFPAGAPPGTRRDGAGDPRCRPSNRPKISHERTGIIMGFGRSSTRALVEAADIARAKGPKRVGPFAVPKAHVLDGIGVALATWFKIRGVNYSISSACRGPRTTASATPPRSSRAGARTSSSPAAARSWTGPSPVLFDAMGAMSSKYNDTPAGPSRAYDRSRDGFVIAGGAGPCWCWRSWSMPRPRRAHLRRGRGLRRHLGWPRHGGPVREGAVRACARRSRA